LPATVFVFLRHGTPESPRWLIHKGRVAEAAAVIKRVYGESGQSLQQLVSHRDENLGVRALFRSGYGARMLYVSAFWTCSIIPMIAIYAFGPKILGALGLSGEKGNLGSAFITTLFLVGSVASLLFINKLGRRRLVLHSFLWS